MFWGHLGLEATRGPHSTRGSERNARFDSSTVYEERQLTRVFLRLG